MVDIQVVPPSPNRSAISMAVIGLSVVVNTDQIASRCLVFFYAFWPMCCIHNNAFYYGLTINCMYSCTHTIYLLIASLRIMDLIFLIMRTANRMNTDVSDTKPPGATLR